MVWCGMVWCGMVWCEVEWSGEVSIMCCGVVGVVWSGMV